VFGATRPAPTQPRLTIFLAAIDAMSSYRPYRAPLSEDFVVGELHQMAGPLLDRDAVDALARHVLSGAVLHPATASLVEATAGQES
jgi:HD-GYP domain-containing protein (c-di-GMP phosphodiesterase class II)